MATNAAPDTLDNLNDGDASDVNTHGRLMVVRPEGDLAHRRIHFQLLHGLDEIVGIGAAGGLADLRTSTYMRANAEYNLDTLVGRCFASRPKQRVGGKAVGGRA